jgi:hypothetical protein
MAWLEDQPCHDCLQAERNRQRAQESKTSAEDNKNRGYIPLVGSEKQIAWAETIRRRAIEAFDEMFEKIPPPVKPAWEKTSSWLKNQNDSGWWIETIGTLGENPANHNIVRQIMIKSPSLMEEIEKYKANKGVTA